jgi:hypothetical protein
VATVGASVPTLLLYSRLHVDSPLVVLAVCAGVFAVLYVTMIMALRVPSASEREALFGRAALRRLGWGVPRGTETHEVKA